MEFVIDFIGSILGVLVEKRMKNKKVYMVVMSGILIAFVAFTLFLFLNSHYVKGAVLAVFDLLAIILLILSLKGKSK